MNEYTFDLIFKLCKDEMPENHLDALYIAGCDDALILMGKAGYLGLSFTREAGTAQIALESAIRGVKQAIPHAQLERAEPDLVNLSELAFLFEFTKQNIRKYARGEVASVSDEFPAPVIAGKTSYWHAAEVAQWLVSQGVISISNSKLEEMFTIWSLNQANDLLHQADPEMTATFTDFLKSVA